MFFYFSNFLVCAKFLNYDVRKNNKDFFVCNIHSTAFRHEQVCSSVHWFNPRKSRPVNQKFWLSVSLLFSYPYKSIIIKWLLNLLPFRLAWTKPKLLGAFWRIHQNQIQYFFQFVLLSDHGAYVRMSRRLCAVKKIQNWYLKNGDSSRDTISTKDESYHVTKQCIIIFVWMHESKSLHNVYN